MKRIIAMLLLVTGLQITASTSAPMIINRTSAAISVTYTYAASVTTGIASAISVPAGQMIIIPVSGAANNTTGAGNFTASATGATITSGTLTTTIPSFAASTSYVINSANGALSSIAGLATYNISSGVATYGTPSLATSGTGF